MDPLTQGALGAALPQAVQTKVGGRQKFQFAVATNANLDVTLTVMRSAFSCRVESDWMGMVNDCEPWAIRQLCLSLWSDARHAFVKLTRKKCREHRKKFRGCRQTRSILLEYTYFVGIISLTLFYQRASLQMESHPKDPSKSCVIPIVSVQIYLPIR